MHRFVPYKGRPFSHCDVCGYYAWQPNMHIDEEAEAAAEHAAHVLRPEDQMTELERKVVERFREYGDRWFGALPDWRGTEIGVGDAEKITGAWIKSDGSFAKDGMRARPPRQYHHRLTISVDRMLEAHTVLGIETIGDAVVVGIDLLADRREDGPVWLVHGMRKYWDQIGWWINVAMRTHDGHFIQNRYRDRTRDVAEIRKAWRRYRTHVPDGMDWDGDMVVRDPNPKDHEMAGTRFSHVIRVYELGMLLAFVREPVEVAISAQRMKDGRWMLAKTDRMWAAIREHEADLDGAGGGPVVEADEEAHLLFM